MSHACDLNKQLKWQLMVEYKIVGHTGNTLGQIKCHSTQSECPSAARCNDGHLFSGPLRYSYTWARIHPDGPRMAKVNTVITPMDSLQNNNDTS